MIDGRLRCPHCVRDNYAQQLVDRLVEIGDRLDLKVFIAGDGVALLDWRSAAHLVLTVWVHDEGADIRIGAAAHTLVPLGAESDVTDLLEVLERVLTDGSWFETYLVDPATGEVDLLSWRLGMGRGASYGVPGQAHRPSEGIRVHHRGRPWGTRGKRAAPPPT